MIGTALRRNIPLAALFLVAGPGLRAQQPEAGKQAAEKETGGRKGQEGAPAAAAVPKSGKAAAERNENVWVSKLDNETLKAEGVRLGDDTTLVTLTLVERNYYAAEHGMPASDSPDTVRAEFNRAWHGELHESHRNSVFNARTFFQVGPVMPSRLNQYGARSSGPVRGVGGITTSFSQTKVRGAVNGNVLVPLPSERTPLVTDPATRRIVSLFIAAYPAAPPNRPDFDSRALNTNAPQTIDQTDLELQVDRELRKTDQLSLSYSRNTQFIDAFQMVAGRNPDTSIHAHGVRVGYRLVANERMDVSFTLGFRRTASDLQPEPNAVGTRVRFGRALEELGPDGQYPIKRAENTFRWGAVGYRRLAGGKHTLTFGADLYRAQVNGIQTNNLRGSFQFGSNFGRTSIQNLLWGTPTQYEVSLGNMNRGFRNWSVNSFFADQWRANARLQIYWGLRHNVETRPVEVNRLNNLPYRTDWNNFGPRFSIAFTGPRDWVARAGYTVSFGSVLPVTYGQVRYNEPSVYLVVSNPDLVNPLKGITPGNSRTSPFLFSPEIVSPYSHQYSLTLEREYRGFVQIRLGYQGSRTLKPLNAFVLNRAQVVDGIPLTTATIDERRSDPRYSSVKHIVNGGIAYLDAAQASLEMPARKGIAVGAAYTFSKAIDEGSSYLGIAANRDLDRRPQSQYDSFGDKKSWSEFDSPHSMLVYFDWQLPQTNAPRGLLMRSLTNGWRVSGAMMVKTGTPFHVTTGSDAPGFGNVDGEGGDRPNLLDSSILGASVSHPDTSMQVLRRELFGFPAPGQRRGNIGWNVFRKQGIRNLNAAISRQWLRAGRRPYGLRFRAEAFNVTNHAQFDEPQYTLSSPAFGKITNTLNDGRVLQLGLRLSF